MIADAVPLLESEIMDRSGQFYLMYRLAWAYNRLDLPESALTWARCSWESDPQNQWYMGELLKSFCGLEMYDSVLEYSAYIKGGGVCRYYLARAETALKTPGSPSRTVLEVSLVSEDDSTAADAANWLSILLFREIPEDSLLALLEFAVTRAPDEQFYRCRYVELLARSGDTDTAREHLHVLRRARISNQAYWQACAALAEAEDDPLREVWALRRAWQSRRTPGTASELGWALYFIGRSAVREGNLNLARERLSEAVTMDIPDELLADKSDSLLELIDEFTEYRPPSGR